MLLQFLSMHLKWTTIELYLVMAIAGMQQSESERETVLFTSPSVGLGEWGTIFSQSGVADGHSVWHFKSSTSRPQSPHNELV